MSEINGFEVDTYNQYNLKEGAKLSTCPKCSHERKKKHDKCLMIDWDRGWASCNHCGELLQLHTYVKNSDSKKEYVLPEWKNKTELSDNAVKWFASRGIGQQVLNKMKISEGMEFMPQKGKKVNTIQFNYFLNGNLVNVKYRTGDKAFKLYKGAEKVFYNLEAIRGTDEAIVVEGEVDVLSFEEVGIDYSVSVPNGATTQSVNLDYLDSSYEFFEHKKKIYIATDNDEAGLNLRAELVRRLGAERCYLIDFGDCKDANEALMKYGADYLRKAVDNAKPVPLENTLTLVDEREQLRNFYVRGADKGYTIGLQSFDDIFSTYLGQYIVVTGIPSSGKSDFVDQMVTGFNRLYGWKTSYCSPENKPTYLHLDKICRKFYGKYPKGNDLNSQEWIDIENHVDDNFFFIDYDEGYDLKKVLAKAKEHVMRKGIKVLVIDPFNKVRLKESMNKGLNDYTNDYLNEFDIFCRKNNILGILVAHPTKMRKEPGNKKLPEPTMYDIKGGGEMYDMSPHGLLVHRDYELNTVMVKVLKVKFHHLGTNQAESHFVWSAFSGRYCEINGEPESHEVVWDNTNWISGKEQNEAENAHREQEMEGRIDSFGGMEITGVDDELPF